MDCDVCDPFHDNVGPQPSNIARLRIQAFVLNRTIYYNSGFIVW